MVSGQFVRSCGSLLAVSPSLVEVFTQEEDQLLDILGRAPFGDLPRGVCRIVWLDVEPFVENIVLAIEVPPEGSPSNKG